MKHLHIMSHAIQALPSAPLLTDLGNNQTCPLPEQETSPKLVSILTPSKQKLMGDKGAHTDTARWCSTHSSDGSEHWDTDCLSLIYLLTSDTVLTYANHFQITPKACTAESKHQGSLPIGSTDKNIPGLAPCRLQSPLTPGLRLRTSSHTSAVEHDLPDHTMQTSLWQTVTQPPPYFRHRDLRKHAEKLK